MILYSSADIPINFSNGNQTALILCLGFVMFGVALGLKKETFVSVFQKPKALLVGLLSQWILLPLFCLLLVFLLKPSPGIALGMFLMAAVPGGNVSNYISKLSGGNIELSVVLTVISTLLALFITPLNFSFWSSFYEPANVFQKSFNLDPVHVAESIIYLTVIPVLVGMLISKFKAKWAAAIEKPVNLLSGIIFLGFLVMAFVQNKEAFVAHAGKAFLYVLALNFGAFIIGYTSAAIAGLKPADRKTISVETGIQNAGLALILILQFFNKNGEAALTAAIWGIWHIFSGIIWALFLRAIHRNS